MKYETMQKIRILFNTLESQYPKGYSSKYIRDRMNNYTLQIYKLRANSNKKITEIFVNACKYISQIQTEIAIHNLREQKII